MIPGVGGKVRRTNKFARQLVTERKTRGSVTKDLFHHLVSFLTLSLPMMYRLKRLWSDFCTPFPDR